MTEEVAKEVEQANHARQEMREMKEQLDRTVAEKLQLEKKVEKNAHAPHSPLCRCIIISYIIFSVLPHT